MDDAGASEENNDDASDGDREELATADDSVSPDPLLLSPTSQDPAANNDEGPSSEESLSSSIPLLEQRLASSAHENSGTLGPLANLRPERYKNANVKDFFPEFRENAPLRFSKLFPVKDSLKPSIWKRLRKRKAREEAEHSSEDGQMAVKKERRGWVKDYAPIEDVVLAECDSVRYCIVLSQVASMCIFAKIGFINQLENQRRLSKLNRNLRSLSSKRVPSLQTGGQGQPSSGMACMIYMT